MSNPNELGHASEAERLLVPIASKLTKYKIYATNKWYECDSNGKLNGTQGELIIRTDRVRNC